MIINQEHVSSMFCLIRDRLSNQAKVLKKELEIKTTGAYEVLSILWGFENYHQLNAFLDLLQDTYIKLCKYHSGDINDHEIDLLHRRLHALKEIYEISGRTLNTRYLMMTSYKELKKQNRDSTFFDIPKEGDEDYEDSTLKALVCDPIGFTNVVNIIVTRTLLMKGREIISPIFIKQFDAMTDNLLLHSGDTSPYNLSNHYPSRKNWIAETLPKVFSLSLKKSIYFIEEFIAKQIDSDILNEIDAVNNNVAITVEDLLPFTKRLHTRSLAQGDSIDPYVGICLSQLPKDAIVNVNFDLHGLIDSRITRMNNTGFLRIYAISVKRKEHLSTLLSCVRPEFVVPFDAQYHSENNEDNLVVKSDIDLSDYAEGYSSVFMTNVSFESFDAFDVASENRPITNAKLNSLEQAVNL